MSMQVDIEADDLFADLKRLSEISQQAVIDTINDVAMQTHETSVQGIQRGPASGRTYTRGTVTHTASAPGEYPMSDTGRLASNVIFNLATGSNPTASVGTNISYGAYLEFGASKMAARPWLLPSFKQSVATIGEELKAKFEGGV